MSARQDLRVPSAYAPPIGFRPEHLIHRAVSDIAFRPEFVANPDAVLRRELVNVQGKIGPHAKAHVIAENTPISRCRPEVSSEGATIPTVSAAVKHLLASARQGTAPLRSGPCRCVGAVSLTGAVAECRLLPPEV